MTGVWRTDAESAERGAEDAEKGKGGDEVLHPTPGLVALHPP